MNVSIAKFNHMSFFLIPVLFSLFLAACGGGGGNVNPPAGGIAGNTNAHAPVISGTPATIINKGDTYSFKPSADDPDGDPLIFAITNKPAWASFNTETGSLTGTPSAADVGTTSGIIISVSDGSSTASLAKFNLTVVNISTGTSIYVDPLISKDCNTYNVVNRDCQNGNATAYATLNAGLSATTPGITLLLRGGSYGQIAPTKSGIEGYPITIMGYPGESASITNLTGTVAIWVINQTDIIIDNLIVTNDLGFARIQDSSRITIQNTKFDTSLSTGTTSALKLVRSTFNRILNNTINNGGGDALLIQDSSDNNLVSNNSFYKAHHSNFSIRCSNYNVIKNNAFSNPSEKIGEIFDCEGVSDAPVLYDATKHNLVEGNLFSLTKSSSVDYNYNAIQHGGQFTIVRQNVFRNNEGGGVNYQQYPDESMYVYGNRLYNNTFYSNRCFAIIGNNPGNPSIYYNNVVSNNLVYKNSDCTGSGSQINIGNPLYVILKDNVVTNSDPLFVDEVNFDFHLAPSSPEIDAGNYLTTVVGGGSGTILHVNDASYFYDGYGIAGEVGDKIQLEGQTQIATITSVDYQNNMITVDKVLSWVDGQGVALHYNGAAPDVGAFEAE